MRVSVLHRLLQADLQLARLLLVADEVADRHPVRDVADERRALPDAQHPQDVAGVIDQVARLDVIGERQLARGDRHLRARLRDRPQLRLRRQRDLAVGDPRVAALRQRQQPKPLADEGDRLADLLGQGLVGAQALDLGEPPQCLGLLDRVQVLALDVRDQRRRQGVLVLADQDRDLLDAGLLRGPQAALSVDQDEVPVLASHGQRRGDPVLLDRRCELLQRRLVELAPGVEALRHLDLGDLDGARLGARGHRCSFLTRRERRCRPRRGQRLEAPALCGSRCPGSARQRPCQNPGTPSAPSGRDAPLAPLPTDRADGYEAARTRRSDDAASRTGAAAVRVLSPQDQHEQPAADPDPHPTQNLGPSGRRLANEARACAAPGS